MADISKIGTASDREPSEAGSGAGPSEAGPNRLFSFTPKSKVEPKVEPKVTLGPGPWGPGNFTDYYGRDPPPTDFGKDDWATFHQLKLAMMQARERGCMVEMTDEDRACYKDMLAEVAMWQQTNRDELAAVRASNPTRSESSTRSHGQRR